MTVAIIGSGKMGSGFARLLASKGFDIAIGNKNRERAIALAKEIGAKVKGGSVEDAVSQADVIFLAVKYDDAAEALKPAGDLTDKVIIDISNPITADFKGLTLGHSTSAAEEDSEACPRRQGREGVQHDLRRASPNRKPQRPQGPSVHRW
jgi:8-hydroxy-5-deazaflavin:NADPH oxidoreductase